MGKLRANTSAPLVLNSVQPNLGLEAEYRRALQRMIKQMHVSVAYWVRAAYKANPPAALLAQDVSPAEYLQRAINGLTKRWTKNFNQAAGALAEYYATAIRDRSDRTLKTILQKGGFTVKFQQTASMKDAFQAVVHENVGLIKSIPADYLGQVQGMVMRSVAAGRDIGALTKNLTKSYDVTKKRAALIARDQNNKATAVLNKTRRLDLGLTQAEWRHSGAGKHPRPSHVKAGAEKLRYDIEKGALIDGEYIQPGELINCRCTSRTIIPGIDDDG